MSAKLSPPAMEPKTSVSEMNLSVELRERMRSRRRFDRDEAEKNGERDQVGDVVREEEALGETEIDELDGDVAIVEADVAAEWIVAVVEDGDLRVRIVGEDGGDGAAEKCAYAEVGAVEGHTHERNFHGRRIRTHRARHDGLRFRVGGERGHHACSFSRAESCAFCAAATALLSVGSSGCSTDGSIAAVIYGMKAAQSLTERSHQRLARTRSIVG